MRIRRVTPEEAGWGQTKVGPWTRTRRTVSYRNPWLTVWHDEVTRPDGEPGIYGVIHFKNAAVGVVAIDEQDRVALVGQHRYAFDAYHWEIPEGGSPPDEDSLDGAKRELLEETGLTAREWRVIGRWELSNSVTDEAAVAYLATDLAHGTAVPDPDEQLEFRWAPFDEVMTMIERGEITDALTVLPMQALALERARPR
ncbi:MAG: NUDIX hydrolase [Candidatus Limnocylindrales bacterium]